MKYLEMPLFFRDSNYFGMSLFAIYLAVWLQVVPPELQFTKTTVHYSEVL